MALTGIRTIVGALALTLVAGICGPVQAQYVPSGSTINPANKRVTVHIDQADVRVALRKLFTSVGASYTMPSTIRGEVTLSLTNVPFSTALDNILSAAGGDEPLTYRLEDGIYMINTRTAPAMVQTVSRKTNSSELFTNGMTANIAAYAGPVVTLMPNRFSMISNMFSANNGPFNNYAQALGNQGFNYASSSDYDYGNGNGYSGNGYGYGGYPGYGYGYGGYPVPPSAYGPTGLYNGVTGQPITGSTPTPR